MYSYPLSGAAGIAVKTVSDNIKSNPEDMDEIIWVLFDDRTKDAYDDALATVIDEGIFRRCR